MVYSMLVLVKRGSDGGDGIPIPKDVLVQCIVPFYCNQLHTTDQSAALTTTTNVAFNYNAPFTSTFVSTTSNIFLQQKQKPQKAQSELLLVQD